MLALISLFFIINYNPSAMKTKRILSACLMLFAFCAVNVLASIPEKESSISAGADMTTVKNDHSRPFKATITYSYSSWWSEGVGNATHLGLLTTVSAYVCDGYNTVGQDVLKAADGSELIMDWSAVFNADYTEDGTWSFSGGTGRFEDAAGSGTLHAIATSEMDLVLYITGTITY
jgi:hypothetical protein